MIRTRGAARGSPAHRACAQDQGCSKRTTKQQVNPRVCAYNNVGRHLARGGRDRADGRVEHARQRKLRRACRTDVLVPPIAEGGNVLGPPVMLFHSFIHSVNVMQLESPVHLYSVGKQRRCVQSVKLYAGARQQQHRGPPTWGATSTGVMKSPLRVKSWLGGM